MRHRFNISYGQRNTQLGSTMNAHSSLMGRVLVSQCGKGRTRGSPSVLPRPRSPSFDFPIRPVWLEPLINKESGREVNQGQWARTRPRTTEDQCVWTQLIRSGPRRDGERLPTTESLKSGVALRGCVSTLGRHVDEV